MSQVAHIAVLFLYFGLMYHEANGIFMQKLSETKLCADDECAYAISLARAEDDYNAPDCRFVNIKKGELIYVYSKLVKPQKEDGEFWFGSVYSDQYRDPIGFIGYFPSNLATEIHVFKNATLELHTTAIDFYCD
ncbi:otoraplin [Pelobates cultripes]|uniref:Otoraplin n=1 Tax=Pelobates cultripes TaxID=61616 RepID=A0AAD1VWX8_PELCU|nr:otoraplin [Pelobates cultripes]